MGENSASYWHVWGENARVAAAVEATKVDRDTPAGEPPAGVVVHQVTFAGEPGATWGRPAAEVRAAFRPSAQVHSQETNREDNGCGLWGQTVPVRKRPSRPVLDAADRAVADLVPAHRFRKTCPHAPYGPYEVQPAEPCETSFRHGGWATTRGRVRSALMATGSPTARIDRFDNCGSGAVVEQCTESGKVRVCSNHCHDRFCKPCAESRSKIIASNLANHVEGKEVRFITLTVKHTHQRLSVQIDRLYTCLRNLRARGFWKDHVDGGAAFVEIKVAKDGQVWHPHLHLIVEGKYVPQKRLSDEWFAVTGDSMVVDVRYAHDTDEVARYVCKYASKALDSGVYRSENHLNEAVLALKGRRMCATFGTWRGIELEKLPPTEGDWRPVCTYVRLTRAAAAGELWAVKLLDRLTAVAPTGEVQTRRTPPP